MKAVFNSFLRHIYSALPETVRANIDFYLRPGLRDSWGGPLNGQEYRSEQIREILKLVNPNYIVETGTFRGTTTEFFARVSDAAIWSCEINGAFHLYAKKRLKRFAGVHLVKAESTVFLRDFLQSPAHRQAATLFYLDAHWLDHLPLQCELEIIFSSGARSVVVVDDFQVPDDPGYQFDDYGSGKALTVGYLAPLRGFEFHLFFPAAPAERESGAKRGCVVITPTNEIANVLRTASSLRYYGLSSATL